MSPKDIIFATALVILLTIIGLTMGMGGIGNCTSEDQPGTCMWEGHARYFDE